MSFKWHRSFYILYTYTGQLFTSSFLWHLYCIFVTFLKKGKIQYILPESRTGVIPFYLPPATYHLLQTTCYLPFTICFLPLATHHCYFCKSQFPFYLFKIQRQFVLFYTSKKMTFLWHLNDIAFYGNLTGLITRHLTLIFEVPFCDIFKSKWDSFYFKVKLTVKKSKFNNMLKKIDVVC